MFITGCTGSCQNDNFQCSQWWKFRQNDDIFVSVWTNTAYACNITDRNLCVDNLIIFGSENVLSPGRHQAIIWTNAGGILLIGPLGTTFSEILIAILTFSFKKVRLKMSSAKWQAFCLDLRALTIAVLNRFTSLPFWSKEPCGSPYLSF